MGTEGRQGNVLWGQREGRVMFFGVCVCAYSVFCFHGNNSTLLLRRMMVP